MKKILLFFAIVLACIFLANTTKAQNNLIYTIAGGGTSTADGVSATSAQFSTTAGVWTDTAGNVYISDEYAGKVRKINVSTGLIYTVAGGGSSSSDGIPATSASLGSVRSIRLDKAGNLYLGDYGYGRIRKVNATTGIITTVAGGGSSDADSIPATNASLNFLGFTLDKNDNIYVFGRGQIKKVIAATGIIRNFAGGGTSSADGILATTAYIDQPRYMMTDAGGNLYFLDGGGNLIRKIDAITGIIKTVAGGGSSSSDTCLAINYNLGDCHSFSLDLSGNVIILDRSRNGKIRRVDAATGYMSLIAGGGSSKAEGVTALTADLSDYHWIHIDKIGNMYITNWNYGTSYARKINAAPSYRSDSFSLYINRSCSGPSFTAITKSYTSGMSVKTWFGDNQINTTAVSGGGSGGVANFSHNYGGTGLYTIKHVLYRGVVAIDSIRYPYEYLMCNNFSVKLYNDANNNCQKDASEDYLSLPANVEIDSNGKAIDNISATNGFNYAAYGKTGDIYSFKITKYPGNFTASCPATGIVTDTLGSSNTIKYIGLKCSGTSGFDLSAHAVVPVTGQYDQWGNIYLNNLYCSPTTSTITMHFSPKYIFKGEATPTATSVSGNTITWNLSSLSSSDANPAKIYFVLRNPTTGAVPIREVIQSYVTIDPKIGDADTNNNNIEVIDTVKGSCDPNEMWVTPAGHILDGTQLEYKIEFENVGNDTAHNIYVMDTLSDYLDVKSMNIVMASHNMNVGRYFDTVYHNILRFDFPAINLLDSSHHDACTGVVIFTIKTKTGLPFGTEIPNHAGIFFDANGVVMTNTVENIIGWPENVAATQILKGRITVYPNPAKNTLQLTVRNWQSGENYSYVITDIMNRQLLQGATSSSTSIVDISKLQPGMYFIQVGANMQRFVKE